MKEYRKTIKFDEINLLIQKKKNAIIFYFDMEKESLELTSFISDEISKCLMLSDDEFNSLNFIGYIEGQLEIKIKIEKDGLDTYISEKIEPNLIFLFLDLYKEDNFIQKIDLLKILSQDKKNEFENILVDISDRNSFLFDEL